MAIFNITSIVASTINDVQKLAVGGVPVWFVTFDVTTSAKSVFTGHVYEFPAANATALKALVQAVADHDEAEELARLEATPKSDAPAAVDPLSVFGA
jgi:hypothetical protein